MLDSRGDYSRESGVFCPDLSRKCLNFDALGTADGGLERRDDEGARDMQSTGFENGLGLGHWDCRTATKTRQGPGLGQERGLGLRLG